MFKKYPSVDNTYHAKTIDRWKQFHPAIESEEFVVLEKIHGTNFSIVFEPGNRPYCASRNRVLAPGEDFFGLNNVVFSGGHKLLLDRLTRLAENDNIVYQVYGELFGPGINKGVFYGKSRDFRLFDLRRDGFLQPHRELEAMLSPGMDKYLVPCLGVFNSLCSAMQVEVEGVNSLLTPEKHKDANILEGVVIKPYNKVFCSPVGDTFILKKKTERFQEVAREPKNHTHSNENPVIADLNQRFSRYITEQRLQNVFSKEGVVSDKKQISKYIRLLIQDAKEEFLKDSDNLMLLQQLEKDPGFTKSDLKKIYNVGSEPFRQLQPYM